MNILDCDGVLHPKAIAGLKLFNQKKFFETHEELEDAWRDETGEIRKLYQGILQIAVAYLHITRGNYPGALKVYERGMKWLTPWPDLCRGVDVGQLKKDANKVIVEVKRLGAENIGRFNPMLFQPVQWNEKKIWICDKCGSEMHEKSCKVSCPNCGNRFDCSDLNIYFD
jgi:rubrerythrin